MGLLIILAILGSLFYLSYLDNKIKDASIRNKINVYTKTNAIDKSQVNRWYKKSFTKEFGRYVYDLSPFNSSLWWVSIFNRKEFNRYLSIDQFNVVVVLSSLHLVLVDSRFSSKELSHINSFYKRFLDDTKRSDLIWLLGLYKKNEIDLVSRLEGNIVLETVVEGINHYFSEQHKYSLIYYLFELAEADKEISNKELGFIFRLANSISLSRSEINSITSLYFSTYIPYPNVGFKKGKKKAKKRKEKLENKYVNHSKLENALSIFNLNREATTQEIKSAYKKMVKKHHPDRVAYLGEEHVLKATEIFKKINVAYDYLEEERGF